ncbi:phage integrase domain protein [Mycobacterium avium MAV_120709_2344]|nr:phage integrase domain protein [Mycobacterium avium MAV_120709_2344]
MTALDPNSTLGLLGRLMAGVRSEFRRDVLEFAADDAVFGGGSCRVTDCGRSARGHGLCQGHHQRWANAGRPDLEEFTVSTDPRWRKHRPNQACRVDGCGYGSARGGLCQLHAQRWERAGRPHLASWLRDPLPVKQPRPGRPAGSGTARYGRRPSRRYAIPIPTLGKPTAAPISTGS